jgi:hypothetical protein
MKLHRVMLHMALLSFALCVAAAAQDTGSITGTVKDPSGAAVPNAEVVVASPDHGIDRHTTTNASGDYNESALPGGTYDVIVTATGFKKYQAKGVKLDVAQKARVDIPLQVGTISTEVVVEGTSVAQVETQSSDLSGTVTGKEISQLELNGRNFTQLVTLMPGVSNQTGQDEGTVGVYGNVSYSMNGGRVEYNNWELDGGDNMDNGSNSTLNVYPSIDAIAEFKVLTSNYGAQYGRNGSGTVEVETKSGTNKFHGDIYEFVRNDAFNARNYFQSTFWSPGSRIPEYKKNDYGYTLGGPAYIPGVYNKDKTKTFFFWSEEWRKDVVPGQTFNQVVPSSAERGGDFSDLCASATLASPADCPLVNGALTPNLATASSTSAQFAANQATAQALLAMIPLPTSGNSFIAAPAQPTNWREELIRVDHNLTSNERLTFRFIHDSWNTVTAVPLWTNQGSFPTIGTAFKGPGVALVARMTSTFSPTLLNEFVFSYTADHIILNDTGNWKRPAGFSSGFTDLFPGNGGGVLPGINLVDPAGVYGNFGEDSGYIPNGLYNSNPTYTFRDNVNKIVGKHNLQFGAYVAAAQKNEFGGELGAGSFPGYLTFDPSKLPTTGCSSTVACTTGNPFADLLLGEISSFGQQDHLLKYYNRYKIVEPYFQDDWRITNHLTLNLGLRLSLYGTYRERLHQAFNFDPAHYVLGQTTVDQSDVVHFLTKDDAPATVNNLPNGIVQCGVTAGVPIGCQQGHLFNPAPRIGFAWDPRGNGRTAIRGGYGIFFEHTNGNEANTESLENSPPLANAEQKVQIVGYANINTSVGTPPVSPLNALSIPNKARWPYVQQWHFDVQQEVAPNTVATVSYVGSKGTHLVRVSDFNQLVPLPLSQNPYAPGEAIGPNDCGTTFDPNTGVPTSATTPSAVPITGQAAVNLGVAACGTLADPLRPFPGYGDISHIEEASSSIYHALQASVRRNVGRLTLSGAYTWSHSTDDSSDRYDTSFVNAYNFATNRASSNFDQRHIFNFSYVWDLPFFKSPGIANKVLGGWQYSGIVGVSSGTPFSATFNTDNAGVADGVSGAGSHPDLAGNPKTGLGPPDITDGFAKVYYNANAFAAPRGLTFGDVGRNTLRNPRRTNFDMALFKHFTIKESVGFEFRAEAFNIFNHTEWSAIAGAAGSAGGSGNNVTTSPGFGQINTAHNPRILQLGAKFLF